MLQKQTVERETFELLRNLMEEPLLASARLVGGTALALQMGHRKSTDLDLFTFDEPDIEGIVATLSKRYGYTPQVITAKSTIGFINGIKIDVIHHPYKWLKEIKHEGNIRLADLSDIAAMKLHAITNSGDRPKDFVDMAYLSQIFSYNEIKYLALEKYPMYDPIMFDKAIIYFNDVQTERIAQIKLTQAVMSWVKIEHRVIKMTDEPDRVFKTPPLSKKKAL